MEIVNRISGLNFLNLNTNSKDYNIQSSSTQSNALKKLKKMIEEGKE